MLRKLYYQIPVNYRLYIRRLWYLPNDLMHPPKNPMIPPKGLIFIGSGDFEKQGIVNLEWMKAYTNLQPDSSVLDIGCGIGRMAIPLTTFLKNGQYDGFDIMKTGIDWCIKKIHSRYPNFRFKWVDAHNELYRNSAVKANALTFPYQNSSYDIQIATSLFTHMMPDDMQHYFSEMYRVAKIGGQIYATFFVINETPINNPSFSFPYKYENYSLMDKNVATANIAFTETFLLNCIKKSGFEIRKIIPGFWREGKAVTNQNFQDILVLEKPDINVQ